MHLHWLRRLKLRPMKFATLATLVAGANAPIQPMFNCGAQSAGALPRAGI